jgi:hypothetical protein
VNVGAVTAQPLQVTDAGGGTAPWTVTVQPQAAPSGVLVQPETPTVAAGASVLIAVSTSPEAAEGEATGFVLLTRGTDVRRVPYWFRVVAPKLGTEPFRTLVRPGVYTGDTVGKPSLVSSYRYPDNSQGAPFPTSLGGPEQVFRFVLRRHVANFGVAVISHQKGSAVSPRLVADGNENRLLGNTALPEDANPYSNFGLSEPVVGAILPTPGVYDFVFDTPTGTHPGAYTFRFWMNDVTPPTVRLLTHVITTRQPLRLALTDAGSGVDPSSIQVAIDNKITDFHYKGGILKITPPQPKAGTHHLYVGVSDYQETKNMEDVLDGATPNTRNFSTTFVVR